MKKVYDISISTLGELKKSGYKPQSIKEELRSNLITNLREGKNSFPGIYGYENSVIPEVERAILSEHNMNLLGLRGQAKTRLARLMVNLLDEYVPVIAGSEINDDPLNPLSRFGKDLVAEKGDSTPIQWMHRSERFYEKLATPDVTVSDLIGDIDPIKAANLKLSYADERVIHFGMIPRANRCIFVINELPDLQARIQVALFNILEEGDIQIRGFKIRMPLDLQFVFTANPEDYTNRGSIVTPLKDRIGSQILTHYPENIDIAKSITSQEAHLQKERVVDIHVPDIAKDLLEQISFEARESDYIDLKSGISARMGITAFENLLCTAERRAISNGENAAVIRFSDFMGVVPSITGKVELVYEGEQEGAVFVANQLLSQAAKTVFTTLFPAIEKLRKQNETTPYDEIILWFLSESNFELLDDYSQEEYETQISRISALDSLIQKYQPNIPKTDVNFVKELILWALVEYKQLSKKRFTEGFSFSDVLNGLWSQNNS